MLRPSRTVREGPPPTTTQRHHPMRWLQTEYLLKGIYLGLVLYGGLVLYAWEMTAPSRAVSTAVLQFNLIPLGAVAFALAVAGVSKMRAGYRPGHGFDQYVLVLMLESSALVYLCALAGLVF